MRLFVAYRFNLCFFLFSRKPLQEYTFKKEQGNPDKEERITDMQCCKEKPGTHHVMFMYANIC